MSADAAEKTRLQDSRRTEEPLVTVTAEDLMPLPPPLDHVEAKAPYPPLSEEQKKRVECGLDGVSALSLPKPKNKEEEDKLVEQFLAGLHKLLSQNDNWAFWQPLMQSLESCVRCQTCSDACPSMCRRNQGFPAPPISQILQGSSTHQKNRKPFRS
jgi:hypothetical protein